MKRILIISPNFPPANGADMQRVRMSLPYINENGWEAEVVMVDEQYNDIQKDDLLLQSVPAHIKTHKVRAFSNKWTNKLGLGSLALRSMYFFRKKVNELLKNEKFDLIYFSTTSFPVLILGAYWKKKYNIPYVIDMQDPWHSNYYEDKPTHERPKKYWFSYRLHKYLEPIAMKQIDGLISVSQAYIDTLQIRYPRLKETPTAVITFGAFKPDFDFVKENEKLFKLPYKVEAHSFNIVYIGRGGHDMKDALILLFTAFKKGLATSPVIFNQIKFHFIGTSYAADGEGVPTVQPLANEMGLSNYVNEQTDRISFYQSIYTYTKADALLIIGSNDPQYTASKIYPYILADRPLMAFFHPDSSASKIIRDCEAGEVISLIENHQQSITKTYEHLIKFTQLTQKETNWQAFEQYSAQNMTKKQVAIFNKILANERF